MVPGMQAAKSRRQELCGTCSLVSSVNILRGGKEGKRKTAGSKTIDEKGLRPIGPTAMYRLYWNPGSTRGQKPYF